MVETEVATAPTTPKKAKGAAKPRKPKTAPSHPKVSEMVNAAIGDLKEKGGSSLQAIKKYVSSHYKVDIERLSPFIRKYLKTAVVNGSLVQTKGKGASGSFKMSGPAAKAEKPKKPVAAAKKPKPSVKKAAPKSPKKAAAAKKPKAKATPKKPKAAKPKPKKAKSPAKKATKAKK